ncbi:MAG: polysaccharide deacetylase family protein [Chloroflexales bacterium]|nr:polysaccharide deacetylase family protein [Chloroflexales bacterium]
MLRHPALITLKQRINLRSRLRSARQNATELLAQNPLGTVTRVITRKPLIALTFDDGPHPLYTPRLLEVLGRYSARATFFVIGEHARRYPEVVQRAAAAGHAIGNHTLSHPVMPQVSSRERLAQIRAGREILGPLDSGLFRPPYGFQSLASRIDALRAGYDVVGWGLSAYDWLDREGPWMAEFIGSRLRPGMIIILHDRLQTAESPALADRSAMITAVDLLLKRYSDSFRFVTVPELMRSGIVWRTHWYRLPEPEWIGRQLVIADEPDAQLP